MFGEEESESEDSTSDNGEASTDNWISSLCFDRNGEYLAVGYNCGQVVVLKQQDEQTYQLHTEFKSHESGFDVLTSMEIEEKINVIQWFPFINYGGSRLLITANDKTIKLFKMYEKMKPDKEKKSEKKAEVFVKPQKVFEGAHAYNINSVAFNSDGETFVSSDDLRINLWNINVSNEAFGIIDIKPENMDELAEVITCSDLHPSSCNILIYATSKGVIRLADLRDSALCKRYAKEFEDTGNDVGGFFQELVTTISDCSFSPCGRFICSRDYLSVKVWDLRMEKRPFKTIKFHEHLMSKLCDLYENDSIFDKFECCWSSDSMRILTGSYNNNFFTCNLVGDSIKAMKALKPNQNDNNPAWNGLIDPTKEQLDSTQKVLHVAWHPKQDLVAIGAKDYGYLYHRPHRLSRKRGEY
jgi:serine/threonine-protein phosphatase 2A regulatory subunit B